MGCNSDSCPIGTGFAPAAASAASGAVAPSGCPCDKGSKRKTPTMGGGIASRPPSDWQSPSFVPQPPPSRKSDVARPSVPTPPAMQQEPPAMQQEPPAMQQEPPAMQQEPPAQKGGSFVPVLTPRVQKQANGKAPIPPRIIDVPADQPLSDVPQASLPQKSTDLGGGESLAPVPFVNTVPIGSVPLAPNPFAPYCGNGIDAASELCRAASDAGLSDYCRQQLLAFLGSKSSQTLGSWIASQELCDQAALRRAVGIAEASIAAKTSAGLYRASGGVYSPHAFVVYGMPHGGTVYVDNQPVMGRWLDAGLTRWEVPLPDANPHWVGVRSASGDARNSSVLDGSTLVFDQMPAAPTQAPTSLMKEGFFSSKPATQLDKPGFGNPFGVDGYAWKQDRVRKPSPLAPQSNSTMDWRSPSGGMPNYHRASGGFADDIAGFGAGAAAGANPTRAESNPTRAESNPTRAEWIAQGNDPDQWDVAFGDGGSADGLTAAEKGRLTAAQTADAFARGRDNPPTDYGRIIGSIGTAVGGVFAAINQAVDQAESRRIRELEVNYTNNARGRELALRERGQELAGEIARLRATPAAVAADPTTTAMIQRLEQQSDEYRTTIQRLEQQSSQGMGTGTAVALGVGAVAILGLGAYIALGGGRRR